MDTVSILRLLIVLWLITAAVAQQNESFYFMADECKLVIKSVVSQVNSPLLNGSTPFIDDLRSSVLCLCWTSPSVHSVVGSVLCQVITFMSRVKYTIEIAHVRV